MERDFMGLNSKESVVVKEEAVDGGRDESGMARNSGLSWPSSNMVSALPQFVPLKSEQDEKPSKNGHLGHPIHDVKMHPYAMVSPFLKARFMGTHQKFKAGTVKQQFLGAKPQPTAPVAGTTEKWINSTAAAADPAQLTIFYCGTVNVFDDISPEKAQAIMLLAGNTYVQTDMTQSKLPVQAPASKHPKADQVLNAPQCAGLPSPMSVSSHPIVSSAVPQARKASLARFLEKRKERAMSGAPYKVSHKAGDCATPESNGICSSSLSVTKETR